MTNAPPAPATSLDEWAQLPRIGLLTGGGDKPYALGFASCLIARGVTFDFIGSDEADGPELHGQPRVRFLNLRGDQRPDASLASKVLRVALYYARLIRYAAKTEARLFHILWNNKVEFFDRTLLLLYYRCFGKRLVFTAHNVNARWRDGKDTWLNRLTLRIQYHLVDHIFVHTEQMKQQLQSEFGVPKENVSVIPLPVNNTIPSTALTSVEARRRLGLDASHKVLLCFGNIAPYKGLEYAVEALARLVAKSPEYRLVIAGRPKGAESYWANIRHRIGELGVGGNVIERIEFVPDEETEIYFKAADVLVLPYTYIFQSGVLFLGYNFGVPAIASDVGSFREDIVEGKTGFMFRTQNSEDLAKCIESYFSSELHRRLDSRDRIREHAFERNSWNKVADVLKVVYNDVLHGRGKVKGR